MHPRTEATLEKLRQEQWFRNVGVRDADSVEVLSSWKQAIKSCSSRGWEDLCLEAANQYRSRLIEKSLERFRRWNDVVDVVKPAAVALVGEKTAGAIAEHHLPKAFLDTVQWDILHLCMEAEFADVYPPGFYASQGYWYVKGHFPCGWRGKFPDGKLVIY